MGGLHLKGDCANRNFAFQSNVQSLKQECFICESKEDIEPHHIKKVKKNQMIRIVMSLILLFCAKIITKCIIKITILLIQKHLLEETFLNFIKLFKFLSIIKIFYQELTI